MAKFDPTNWHECAVGEVVSLDTANVRVNASRPSSLFVCLLPDQDDPEPLLPVFVCAGFGTTFDVDVGPDDGRVRFYLDGPEDCQGFFWQVSTPDRPARRGSFTNQDRRDDMRSEAYDAVYGEVRRMQLEMRGALAGMKRDAARRRQREAKDAADAVVVTDPPESVDPPA